MNLALFDFDGTITSRDTFVEFVRFAIHPSRWRIGKLVLSPWIAGYRLGVVPPRTIRAAVARVAFWGAAEEDLSARGKEFATLRIPSLIRPEAWRRIEWHRERGDQIVIVSASLDVYLGEWCQRNGFALLCTILEVKNGKVTGRYLDGDCSGSRKRHMILRDYDMGEYETVYAYGDTVEDAEMLELADYRYFKWREVAPGAPLI